MKANGEKKAGKTFEVETDADKAVANLSLPVVPLSDIGAASTTLSAGVTLEGAECMDLHEGAA